MRFRVRRLCRSGRKLAMEAIEKPGQSLQDAAARHGRQALDLALDDVLILRKLLGQIRDLLAEEGANPEDHQKRRQHDGCHGRDAS